MDVNSGNIRCLQTINTHVWAGGSNNNIVCWSATDKDPKYELAVSDAVLCLAKVGGCVWAGVADCKLRVVPYNE